jgi:hypothetical protein
MLDGMKAIDWAGCLSILAVTLMLLLGLDFGGKSFPWSSPKVICLLVFGGVAIGLFFFSEKKLAKYPLMPLLLFRNRTNVAALVVTFVHGIVSYWSDHCSINLANMSFLAIRFSLLEVSIRLSGCPEQVPEANRIT